MESLQRVADVAGGVGVQLSVLPEDDDCNVDGAEDGEFMRLLEEAAFALEEGSVGVKSQREKVDVRWENLGQDLH